MTAEARVAPSLPQTFPFPGDVDRAAQAGHDPWAAFIPTPLPEVFTSTDMTLQAWSKYLGHHVTRGNFYTIYLGFPPLHITSWEVL